METHLHAQNSALLYTTVTKSQRPALAPAKCTNVASKPTFVLKVTNAPQAVAPPVVSPTPKPSKGKAVALPTMDYEVSLAYDDDKYGSDFYPTENAAEEAKAGRVLDLRPASNAEFQLALRALEQAHAERNVHKGNLLLAIWQYISNCHKTDTASRTTVQRSSLNQWRAPSWAEKLKYNPETGTVKPMGVTKEEDRNQRVQEEKDGPTKQALLLLAISDRLGLTVNGVPDPRLGIISSPRHKDHPLLWMEWAAKVTHILPKGVTFTHNGYLRFAPLFKEKKRGSAKVPSEDADRRARQRRGKIITMGLMVLPTPSWDIIEFSPAMDEMECAGHLASRGVTTTEVCDASQYAYTWLEHSDETEQDTQTRILINTYQGHARQRPESQPWPDNLAYTYNSSLARWMPVLPAAEATRNVVSKPSTSTNKGGTTTLSLTGTGTPGLQPHNTAVPPATTVAGNAPTGDILDENVDMEEPCDEEDPSRVMETDTT
ncbi:hypothetical protein PILCRDRAFT_13977 [Piloderma croceum F 1598]|uniref:Uncharacterized protein n=1 Tax=Piloderma croceum (strain F 1598) TaxID=765440 RepID=A0A0C3ER35_PILCF|nr:hypothetical protein PILCRDRAFT_13977 [Piloderma croceum F 1598]